MNARKKSQIHLRVKVYHKPVEAAEAGKGCGSVCERLALWGRMNHKTNSWLFGVMVTTLALHAGADGFESAWWRLVKYRSHENPGPMPLNLWSQLFLAQQQDTLVRKCEA